VAVGEEENGIISFGVNGLEEAAGFILREEVDAGSCPSVVRRGRFMGLVIYINI
jgi:hypothetical protein